METYKYVVDKPLVNSTLAENLKSPDDIMHGYAIVINNKIFHDKGKYLFGSTSQATKSFYNCISWKIKHRMYLRNYEELRQRGVNINYLRDFDYSRAWKEFKKYLINNCDFKIISI